MEESNTVGLTTPQLHDGEIQQDQDEKIKKDTTTIYDIASSIDSSAKKLLESFTDNDDEIRDRLDKVSAKMKNLTSKLDDLKVQR